MGARVPSVPSLSGVHSANPNSWSTAATVSTPVDWR